MNSDKPPPYRRPMPPDYAPPKADILYSDNQNVSGVVGGILAAYRINPIMIAMIVLLLTILGALGYYMLRNDDRMYGYIAMRDNREANLYDRLIEMAQKCQDLERERDNYPRPNFPSQFFGGQAFKDNPPRNK